MRPHVSSHQLPREGVIAIANTEDPTVEADIVFVHGLGGSAFDTWRYGKEGSAEYFFWPHELGTDLPKCAIWTVGYAAGIAMFDQPGMIIEARAGNISLQLSNAGLGSRPIIFITHSLGGLVVKSLIVESQMKPDVDRKRIVDCVRGVVFCGTPHRGAGLASAASILGQVFGVQAHVREMKANSISLDHLHDKFVEWHRHNPISIESYVESVGIFRTRWFRRPLPTDVVVTHTSANTGIPGHVAHDIDADHLTLVKPRDRAHPVYSGVLRCIQKTIESMPAGSRFSRIVDCEVTEELVSNVQRAAEISTVSLRIPVKIAVEYAKLAPPGTVARAVISNANSLRSHVDPDGSVIDDSDLLLSDVEVDPVDYWLGAFERARLHGDRMVVSLLSVIDNSLLSADVAELRSEIINAICHCKNRTT